MSAIFKKFRQDITAIVFLSGGLFVALSLVSYNPQDPSLNSLGSGLKSLNYCGLAGSFLADLLYQVFGVAAWVFVVGAARQAWLSFQGETFRLRDIRVIWGFLLVLSLSTLLGLYFDKTRLFHEQIYPGGLLGLSLSQALVRVFNPIGVQVVLWSALTLLAVFYSEKTLQEMAEVPTGVMRKLKGVSWFVSLKEKTKEVVQKKKAGVKKSAFDPKAGAPKPLFAMKEAPSLIEEKGEAAPAFFAPESPTESLEEAEQLELPGARRRVVLKAKPPKRIENWKMPNIGMLEDPPASRLKIDRDELRRKADLLTEKLLKFKIEGQIVDAKPGPLVTMYEFRPSPDVKISEISNLEDDLSLALSSESVRVMGQIPGTDVVGIETANSKRETVFYKDLLAEEGFWKDDNALPIALGKQANGEPKIVNLRPMPHLLIAGTTGSGKSVFVRSIITGLLFRHSPKTLRLILIDPKMVDLADFKDVPHLILPHIIEPKKAVTALRWAVHEMDKRYRSLSKFGAVKIEGFNEKAAGLTKEETAEHEKFNQDLEGQPGANRDQYYYQPLPYIVIVCDELADLMVSEKQNLEPLIQKLVQKARACGIHLIFATQSPRKEVVTGLIKTNIPARIALKVASPLDSRIILEETGAERLLPNGDMLFLAPGVNKPARHHGPYLSDGEVKDVVQFWSNQSKPEFDANGVKMLEGPTGALDGDGGGLGGTFSEDDAGEEYDHIVRWTTEQKTVSASMLQRRFQIGYPKAARFIELMEQKGIVSPANGSKPRMVLAGSLR
ncbi:MAG: DNA translocase FtsK 4TM domain-containing protein [Bdellovibrionaceae bacterium]|nr:DNA translocase FtsK 4TM domain-containing protein [Pseudobdellovibrionaceae bacterium]MBX3033688.1 DNA translocase FtsK 4TM domain-containing protein [Pseudobdellovibrionaceae bacterium]